MWKRVIGIVCCVSIVGGQQGCATTVNGYIQRVKIISNPARATVTVDGQPEGKTPVFVDLWRNQDHVIHIQLAGYEPYDATLSRKLDGAFFLNFLLLLFFPIGMVADSSSGAMWRFDPDHLDVQLKLAP